MLLSFKIMAVQHAVLQCCRQFLLEDPSRFPTVPSHHKEIPYSNRDSVLPKDGKFCTSAGCKVTSVYRAILQSMMGPQAWHKPAS